MTAVPSAARAPVRRPQSLRMRFGVPVALLAPTVVLLVVFFIAPLVVVLSRSFTEPELGFDNYVKLVESGAFRAILKNTLFIALWTTVVSLVLGYPLAYRMATLPDRWARPLLVLTLIPLFTAILARLYAWTIVLGRGGPVNDALLGLNVVDSPLDLLFNRTAVVIGMVHVMLPYMVLVLYSTMKGIDRSLLEAAQSMGASRAQAFWRVFWPLSLHGVYAGALLVFILALGFFITPAVLGGAGDMTIATFVEQQIAILQWGVAMAMAVVLVLVTVVLFIVFNRLFGAERLVTGGVRK